jgi:hypothetical protein
LQTESENILDFGLLGLPMNASTNFALPLPLISTSCLVKKQSNMQKVPNTRDSFLEILINLTYTWLSINLIQ